MFFAVIAAVFGMLSLIATGLVLGALGAAKQADINQGLEPKYESSPKRRKRRTPRRKAATR